MSYLTEVSRLYREYEREKMLAEQCFAFEPLSREGHDHLNAALSLREQGFKILELEADLAMYGQTFIPSPCAHALRG